MENNRNVYSRSQKRKLFKPTLLLGKNFISIKHSLNVILVLDLKSSAISNISQLTSGFDKSQHATQVKLPMESEQRHFRNLRSPVILPGNHSVKKIFLSNFSIRKPAYFSINFDPWTSASLFWRVSFTFKKIIRIYIELYQLRIHSSTKLPDAKEKLPMTTSPLLPWDGYRSPEELDTHSDCLRLAMNFQSPGRILSPVFLSKTQWLCYKSSESDFALGRVQETVGWGGGSSSRSCGRSQAAFPPSSRISALALFLMDRD